MALETRYAARRDWPVERLVESLAALLPVRKRALARQRITFLDTADGRLGQAGACLTSTADGAGNRVQWQYGNQRIGCTVDDAPQFAWDIPQGSMRQRIESIVGSRRLLPLAHAEQDGVLLEVMNETHKTIARLGIVAGRARGPKPRSPWQPYPPFLTLNALRGYDEQCAGPIAIVESRPGIEGSDGTLQAHVLRAIGATLPQDVSAYRVELEPMVRTDAGMLRMQRELLRIIGANHAGVVANIDSVFLQDFRVGVARSRALLGQIEGALPQTDVDHFKSELAWLDRITEPAHRLDMLLLGLRSPAKGLDDAGRHLILAAIEHDREIAQHGLSAQLTSERYGRFIECWQAFLSQEPRGTSAEGCGALPLMTIVAQRAWSLFQLTLSGIERVRSDTPAHELHQIHGNATQLRYLIDAAASLYDPDNLAIVLRALGRLQAAVGEYSDACARAVWLRQYGKGIDETVRDATVVRQAAEVLADLAELRSSELRKPMNQQLLRFGESAIRNAFERVFHIKHLIELVQ